jgi:hypothetical protein
MFAYSEKFDMKAESGKVREKVTSFALESGFNTLEMHSVTE